MRVIINSIPQENKVSTKGIDNQYNTVSTLKPLKDEEFQNSEIEKSETVLLPDLTGFYKAGGKTHKRGGTPVSLEPGTFIFSNDKSLAFSEEAKKRYELPKGGNWKQNTPAALSMKLVKPKDYNKWMQILLDDDKDKISKNSATLMSTNALEKLGAIATHQEELKNFPDGIPDFAQGTAPVYDDELKDEITKQPQYMRYGGLKKYQDGGVYTDPQGYSYTRKDLERIKKDLVKYPGYFEGNYPGASEFLENKSYKFNPNTLIPEQFRYAPQSLSDVTVVGKRKPVNWWSGVPAQGSTKPTILYQPPDSPPPTKESRYTTTVPEEETLRKLTGVREVLKPNLTPGVSVPKPRTVDVPRTQPDYETRRVWQNVPLSPLQQANIAYLGTRALSQRPQYPLRINERFQDLQAELINPETTINAIQAGLAQGLQESRISHPFLANANNQLLTGRAIDATTQAIGQINNQNPQIRNQVAQYNNQGRNSVYNRNQVNDFNYQNQVDQANLNTQKDRMDAENATVNYFNSAIEGNQKLEQFLNSQRTYGRNKTPVRDKNGNILYYEAATPFVVDNTGWSPRVGYNRDMEFDPRNVNVGANRIDSMEEVYAGYIKAKEYDPNLSFDRYWNAINKNKAFQLLSQSDSYPPVNKKGGVLKYSRKKYRGY